jgi:hypothetical protein
MERIGGQAFDAAEIEALCEWLSSQGFEILDLVPAGTEGCRNGGHG